MLYIIVALKAEAQAFVDKFSLNKFSLNKFTCFQNENITLIVSGIGINNAMHATQTLINYYDISDEDTYLNLGICGACKDFSIGEIIDIGSIEYQKRIYTLQSDSSHMITCVDHEINHNEYKIVDMESFGFYEAVSHSPAIKKHKIIKVVSDHFEPDIITKEYTKSLIFNTINIVKKLIS